MTRVLIDTNVVLDWLLRREPHDKQASAILALIESELIIAHFAAISLNNAYYIARTPPGVEAAQTFVVDVRRFGQMVPMVEEVVDLALSLAFDDLEDAIQAASAIIVEADWIVTRNGRDFGGSPVAPISPAAFVQRLLSDE